MKTTADLILSKLTHDSVIHYMDEYINISNDMRQLIENHYKNHVFDEKKERMDSRKFSFECFFSEDDVLDAVEAKVILEYNNGAITIFIEHLGTQCPECHGTGIVETTCESCGSDIEEDCLECDGYGRIDDNWELTANMYDLDIPKEIVYKTIDLRQGELF